jgi:methylated-DNA-[protein]-cysteine S-methyltransferase
VTWTLLDPTPVGPLLLTAEDGALTGLYFGAKPVPGERDDDDPFLREVAAQLGAYFAGRLRDFDLPLAPRGTPFQRSVWDQLRLIPYGTTTTYGTLARTLGNPGASRAVGLANGRNPISIVVPCHRVIGANGSLTGFGGGMSAKRVLLELESSTLF